MSELRRNHFRGFGIGAKEMRSLQERDHGSAVKPCKRNQTRVVAEGDQVFILCELGCRGNSDRIYRNVYFDVNQERKFNHNNSDFAAF